VKRVTEELVHQFAVGFSASSGSKVSFIYEVFGHPVSGLGGIAQTVDAVTGDQLSRPAERLSWG
jgi:hypothetical protein